MWDVSLPERRNSGKALTITTIGYTRGSADRHIYEFHRWVTILVVVDWLIKYAHFCPLVHPYTEVFFFVFGWIKKIYKAQPTVHASKQ
jgi:hypothetical protein